MNRDQAKQRLIQGFIVKHPSYIDGEFTYMRDGLIRDEEDNAATAHDFWKYRDGDAFNKDWVVAGHKDFNWLRILGAGYEIASNNDSVPSLEEVGKICGDYGMLFTLDECKTAVVLFEGYTPSHMIGEILITLSNLK